MKEYDREVKKAYERMGKLKADVNNTPLPITIAMYALTVIALLGLGATLFMGSNPTVMTVANIMALGGASSLLLLYLLTKLVGPLKYSEVIVKHEGVFLFFQVITEKHVLFSNGQFAIEYKKGQIKDIDGLLFPHMHFNSPTTAEYSERKYARQGATYVGVSEAYGKKIKYVVSVENKFVVGFKANGKRVFFDCINQKDAILTIPKVLADEIRERGVALPKDIVAKK